MQAINCHCKMMSVMALDCVMSFLNLKGIKMHVNICKIVQLFGIKMHVNICKIVQLFGRIPSVPWRKVGRS